jgi:bifunctional enzyme CysN/CysC
MISGAARAEAAVLVIDAKEGVRENSRRHGYILSMLGIRQIIVCVNKMDLVDRSESHFQKIEKEYRAFLKDIGSAEPRRFIPISALNGENLTEKSDKMSWYKGPTLLESLDTLEKAPSKSARPFRMPVQAVYKFTSQGDDRRIIAGRIEAGRISIGDRVLFSPSNKSSTVKTIEAFNADPRTTIDAGWSTGFTLSEEIYITRGEVMSLESFPPQVSTRFRANMIWLGKTPFERKRDYKLKIHTQAVSVQLKTIHKVMDASESGRVLDKDHVGRHDVADVILETRQPIAFDEIAQGETTGRFVLVDGYDIAGGGIIVAAEKDNQEEFRAEALQRDIHWIKGGVTPAERAQRFGHQAALVMFVGNAGVGKHALARSFERALFAQGKSTYMLDGTNVLLGVDSDLIYLETSQRELVRRYAEVAHLFLDAGHILVSTTNSIGLADVAGVQALIPDFPIIVVEVDPSTKALSTADLRLTGKETEQTLLAKITPLLQHHNIFP